MTSCYRVSRWQPIKLLKLTSFKHATIFAQEMNLGRQNMYSVHSAGSATKSRSEYFLIHGVGEPYPWNFAYVDPQEFQTSHVSKENISFII
jgi:hypothetical protein